MTLLMLHINQKPLNWCDLLHAIKHLHTMKNEVKKFIFTLFSPYIPLFKANNSRYPSLQVESHRWGSTAIVVKTKEERWGSQPLVTWERPGPVHAFATHTRGPLQTTQSQAGKRTMRCSRRRTTEEWTQGPSFVIPLIHQFSPGLLKRIGANCVREVWAIMWAVLQASISFLSMSEVVGVTYLSGPNGIKPVTFLLWDITCGTTTAKPLAMLA